MNIVFSKSRFNTRMMDSRCFLSYIPTPLSDETYRWSLQVLVDIVVLISPALLCCLNALGAQQVYAQTTAAWRKVFFDHIMPYHAARNVVVSRCIKRISEESRLFCNVFYPHITHP